MAMVGLRYVVAAAITTETPGSAIVYDTTHGKIIGKAIAANITWTRNDNPLYADDTIAENDNGITSGTIELNLDDLSDEVRAYILGDTTTTTGTGTAAVTSYHTNESASPYVGVGYVRVRRKSGVTKYQANWIHKVQFSEENENAQTKGETIEWQTPTINGRIMGVQNTAALTINFKERAEFETFAAAKTWLNTKAGVT